ncbi:uncharacterized protein [Physcomitrium patens]|nr:endonuclease V-like isoform X2 [Physcomitrium patens]XP_024377260.1 endonuclease V-like isoform X2 [Physcomitrium patens]|eukprot:XP_024377259.1 endonuclease V-like isoform X2 [Physcomitrella patens]
MEEMECVEAKKRNGLSQTDIWIEEQDAMKEKLVMYDDFPWRLNTTSSQEGSAPLPEDSGGVIDSSKLRYVGGVDLSFVKENSSFACGALVVMDLETMQVAYEDYETVKLTMPYVAGFLAFRETPVFLGLLERMAAKAPLLYPQLLMVDGNGILHPRGFGLASHLGVLADIPTIGIGKNLHHIDGLTNLEVRHIVSETNLQPGAGMPLVGRTGKVWGMAFRSHEGCSKPVFISIGHRISLDTAVEVVRRCTLHRVPEPVRQADLRSREYLRKHPISVSQPT